MPEGSEEGIIRGMYLLEDAGAEEYRTAKPKKELAGERVRLLGSGTILREVRKAAQTLRDEFGCHVDVWSVTSFNELRREALSVSRSNMLNPTAKPKKPFVTEQLETQSGPVIATTDYMMSYADQVREFVPGTYRVLGTDGFGRSDSREKLRHFFEVDEKFIALAALTELRAKDLIDGKQIAAYMKKQGIDSNKPNPLTC
jgi:pyruvate dehydrogenase E1 component